MSEDPQGHGIGRSLRRAAPFAFVALILFPLLSGRLLLFPIIVLVIVGCLLFRDYIAPWYRNPRIPESLRHRRLAKVLIGVAKWMSLLPVVVMGIPLLAGWFCIPGPSARPGRVELDVLFVLAVPAVAAVTLEVMDRRLKWPRPVGYCQRCGYNLTGNASGRCPECGVAIGADWQGNPDKKDMAAAPTPPEMRNQ